MQFGVKNKKSPTLQHIIRHFNNTLLLECETISFLSCINSSVILSAFESYFIFIE